jgi:2-keto-3-deoxy-L-rhamnonate aldolase RhmA
MNKNNTTIKERLKNKSRVLGVWNSIPSPSLSNVTA